MIERDGPLSLSRQCALLGVSRSSQYYRPKGESAEDLALMRRMDELHMAYPFYGSRQLMRHLRREGVAAGRYRIRRLMRLMGMEATYRRPRTSVASPEHRVFPYLLRGLTISRADHVWCADITYVPGLAEFEAQAAGIIESIHQDASLQGLSHIDRAKLALFIAIQALRTRHQRTNILHTHKLLIDKMNRIVPADMSEARLPAPTEEDAKRVSLGLIVDGAEELAEIIAAKPWVLARAPNGPLYIGDNPVTMYNERDTGFYGNIGFTVPGVEIRFPLGPTLALFIPCRDGVPLTVEGGGSGESPC